jgi:uncharacterized protein
MQSLSALCVIGSMLLAPQELDSKSGRAPSESVLVVTGSAEIAAEPDRALVTLGATIQAVQAATAQQEVNRVMQGAITAIQELGVPPNRIQTVGLSLFPVYSNHVEQTPTNDVPKVVGYRASNSVQVDLQDLKLLGAVIDAGIGAGANDMQGIAFGLRDDTQQRAQALAQAMRNAQHKAETLAGAANVVLGDVRRIEEGAGDARAPMYEARMSLKADTPVRPGEVRVEAFVTATYPILAGGSEPKQTR